MLPTPSGGRYCLTPEWCDRFHRLDDAYSASEYGLMEFEEEFLAREWPEVAGVDSVLTAQEYEQAAARVRAHHDRVFGRN